MSIVIVAEHPLAAEAIRRELRHAAACPVLGYMDGHRPCAAALAQAAPEVVVVDQMADAELTLTRIREARKAAPEATVLLLTGRMEQAWLAEATGAGVDSVISRSLKPGAIGVLVREVARGNVYHAFPRPRGKGANATDLTHRELEILRLMAAGASNAGIAAELWVTEQTVKFHLSNVYRKLGVANRTQASHYAHTHGLLEPVPGSAPNDSVRLAA